MLPKQKSLIFLVSALVKTGQPRRVPMINAATNERLAITANLDSTLLMPASMPRKRINADQARNSDSGRAAGGMRRVNKAAFFIFLFYQAPVGSRLDNGCRALADRAYRITTRSRQPFALSAIGSLRAQALARAPQTTVANSAIGNMKLPDFRVFIFDPAGACFGISVGIRHRCVDT